MSTATLHPLIAKKFAKPGDFRTIQTNVPQRAVLCCGRMLGKPWMFKVDLEEKQLTMLDPSEQQIEEKTVRAVVLKEKLSWFFANSAIFRERINLCLKHECEYFAFSGRSGPFCMYAKSKSGCFNKDYSDESWGCPLPEPVFTPLTVSA